LRVMHKFYRFVRSFGKDTGGQFAVITAVVGLPLLLVSASALDINRAFSKNLNVRSAIDAAALAAVVPANMTNTERYAYAQTVFDNNYYGVETVNLEITGDRERVDIEATTQVLTMMSGVVGINFVAVRDSTSAILMRPPAQFRSIP